MPTLTEAFEALSLARTLPLDSGELDIPVVRGGYGKGLAHVGGCFRAGRGRPGPRVQALASSLLLAKVSLQAPALLSMENELNVSMKQAGVRKSASAASGSGNEGAMVVANRIFDAVRALALPYPLLQGRRSCHHERRRCLDGPHQAGRGA